MTDEILDEAHQEERVQSTVLPNPHLLAYDFFKHMTTLSVLTLGGVLTLSSSIFAENLEPGRVMLSVALIAASGVIAFAGQNEIVDWANRGGGKEGIMSRWGRGLVAMTYGAGVGAFLSIAYGALT